MGEPLGADRGMGAGRGRKMGVEWKRDMVDTGTQHRNPGSGKDLGIRSRTASEVIAGTSGGGWWVGMTSRWTFSP